jgi:hypothetical protein
VFENQMLRRLFECKRQEAAAAGWRKLHDKELHNLYSVPRIIKMIKSRRTRWTGHVAHKILVRKREGKLPLGRPKRGREGNIRIDFREIGWEVVNWIGTSGVIF